MYQRIHKSSPCNPPSKIQSSLFAPNRFTVNGKDNFPAPVTQRDIESETFNQNKSEAFGLQLKQDSGKITPVEQERLDVLQAKMDDFWAQKEERLSHFGHRLDKIPIHSPEKRVSATVRPPFTIRAYRANAPLRLQKKSSHPADLANGQLKNSLLDETLGWLKKYKKNSKTTKQKVWQNVLESVKPKEKTWQNIHNHVMLGENTRPPKGFHSKQKQSAAFAIGVGEKNPSSVGPAKPYKQWIKNKGDNTLDNLKISTFFPDNWTEEKIAAAFLLQNAGEDHQVEASFSLVVMGDTTYPQLNKRDPPKPES